MSVKTRIAELNTRLATTLTDKGIEASADETTTALIDKVAQIEQGGGKYEEIYNLATHNGTNFYYFFQGNTNMVSMPQIDFSQALTLSYMCNGCTSLATIPVINASKSTTFENAFNGCSKLVEIYIDTASSINCRMMFQLCSSLTHIGVLDLRNCTNVTYMLNGASKVHTIDKIILSSDGSNLLAETTSLGWNGIGSIVNVEIEGVIIKNVNAVKGQPLSSASAISFIKALKDYSGTEEEGVYAIYFSATTIANLEAEGETSPNGNTWLEYIYDKGWIY